ncbi:MAG: hypothetical protein N2559_05865 [Anaerolineae bacterium]|nr:hypothetical protein [Anaerolineae bacterium]
MSKWQYLILTLYLILATLYAIFTPKWQAPDEPAHFNYIRAIAETGTLPVLQFGDYDHAYLEQIKAAKFPATMSIDPIRYESYQPPLYYLAATPIYLAARGAGLDATVLALRLFSVVLGVLVLLVAFRIVRAIFPDDDLLPLATVGLMATVPQHLAVSASISNDLAAELVLILILWLAVRRVQSVASSEFGVQSSEFGVRSSEFGVRNSQLATRNSSLAPRPSPLATRHSQFATRHSQFATRHSPLATRHSQFATRHSQFVILGGILFGAALLTKTTAYFPGALLLITAAIAHGGRRSAACPERTRRVIGQLLVLFALAFLIASPMFIRGALTYGITDPLGIARHDAVVVGQPTTAEVIAQRGFARVAFDFFAVTFKSFWAQFGWMGVLVSDRIYVALALLCAVAVLGFTFHVSRLIRHPSVLTTTQRACIGLLMVLLVVAFADYVAYNFKFLQFQGRYLFPALISIAFVLVSGLRELIAREYQRIVFALLYAAMVVLDGVCLFWFIVPQLRVAS